MDIRCTPVAPNVQPPDVQQCMCNNFWRVKVLRIGYNRFILYPHRLVSVFEAEDKLRLKSEDKVI